MNENSNQGAIVEVNEANFQTEVMEASEPVVVDFFATWCGPCRRLTPVLTSLAQEYAGRVKFAKVDVDQSPQLAAAFRVTGVPMLAIMLAGRVVDQMVGFMTPQALRERIESLRGNVAMPV
ncbi:MAG: thioredoxin [Verrucomicrobiales bacterium]|nr:thioredoxin [Verrucomicrobiales bacterium]